MRLISLHTRTFFVAMVCGWLALSATNSTAQDFTSLFDGTSLKGWDGDQRFWRAEDGQIVGETTEENPAPHNTFLIYRKKEFSDFELRFSYQVEGYNSGVQYRSQDMGDFVVRGLQADFEARWHPAGEQKIDRFSGMFFEEKGRMFLGQRGDVVIVRADPQNPEKHVVEKIGSVGDPRELEQAIHRDDWNEYIVLARGHQFTHIINGRVMAIGIDLHESGFRDSGILAFQLHSGPPMRIRLKDIRIRTL